ncbi:unnamed protein product, partial [Rotaria magnacalcarata]
MSALSFVNILIVSNEPFTRYMRNVWSAEKHSENSSLQKRSTDLEAINGCPKFIFIPRCTLEYGLQRCVDTLK